MYLALCHHALFFEQDLPSRRPEHTLKVDSNVKLMQAALSGWVEGLLSRTLSSTFEDVCSAIGLAQRSPKVFNLAANSDELKLKRSDYPLPTDAVVSGSSRLFRIKYPQLSPQSMA